MSLAGLHRFADPAVLILSSLAGGDRHGYALIADIEDFAGVTVGPGTLYAALTRLLDRGLVEALPVEGRRRPYRLTAVGANELRSYLTHTRTVASVGLRRLALS